jgi:hypothetical protein
MLVQASGEVKNGRANSPSHWRQILQKEISKRRLGFERGADPAVLIQLFEEHGRESGAFDRPSLPEKCQESGAALANWLSDSRSKVPKPSIARVAALVLVVVVLAAGAGLLAIHLNAPRPASATETASNPSIVAPPPQTSAVKTKPEDKSTNAGGKMEFAAADAQPLAAEKARTEAEAKAHEEARLKSEAEEKARQEKMARKLSEEKVKENEEAKAREQTRLKTEAEAKAKEQARLKAEAEERARAEAEAKRIAAEKAKAEGEANRMAQEKAEAEAEAKRIAKEKAKAEAAATTITNEKPAGEVPHLPGERTTSDDAANVVRRLAALEQQYRDNAISPLDYYSSRAALNKRKNELQSVHADSPPSGRTEATPTALESSPSSKDTPQNSNAQKIHFAAQWIASGEEATLKLSSDAKAKSFDVHMIRIAAATYKRGDGSDDAPRQDATLSAFYLSQDLVSEDVSWSQAQDYCRKIQSACPSLKVVRLPMEVEWEYVAKLETAAEAGRRGLHGFGNGASEWMQDVYLENAYYAFNNNAACPRRDSPDPALEHVVRGGPSVTGPSFVTRRLRANDQRSNKGRGFRLVVIPE